VQSPEVFGFTFGFPPFFVYLCSDISAGREAQPASRLKKKRQKPKDEDFYFGYVTERAGAAGDDSTGLRL
jgi:hypothetical protein